MSQSEEIGSSRPPSGEEEEVEEQMEEDTPLMAVAPDASLPEERPSTSTDISVSPAFQGLDELFSLGKISKTKVAKLKASYRLLHDTLKSTQESEIQLLGEAKRCRGKLEGLQAEVERAEEQATSEEPDTEVGKLRQQLLQAYNDLKAAEDREYKTQYKLECLQEEKRCLDKEYEMQPEPVGLESRTKALKDRYEDLRKEVTQSQLEVRSLMEDMETREMQILREQKELEDKNEIIEIKQAEMAQLITAPNQLLNEIERMSRKRADAMKNVEALNKKISKMKEQLKEMDEHNCAIEEEKKEAMKELEGYRAQVEATQREYRMLLKEQETNKEKEAVLMGNRGMLEMKLQNVMTDSKLLYKRQSMQLREKNRQMRALKRMEYALKSANEQLEHTQSIYNKTKMQRDAAPKGEASLPQRIELQREVDALKVRFEKQQSVAENESQMKQQEWTMQELLRESKRLREELHNLGCLTQIKAEERGQKHRELRRAQQINQHIQQELREKCLVIMEHNKLNTMLQRRLAQYTEMYDMIRGEKNKYVNLKQIASQTIVELTNQFKILDNEVEIQRTIGINKDRSLAKARMKHCHSHKMRDSLRNNISKMAWKLQQIGQQCEEHKLDLMKLTQMIDVQEQALLEMTKSHKTAIQRRNYLGVQLLEREEEVCIFYEKTNVQEATIAKGNKALEMLEEEMRDLQLAVSEEQRQIDLKKKEVPLKSKLEGEVVMLQIELSEAKDRTLELEKALEELSQESRTRELKGTDPTTVDLVKKIEQLELYLAEREEQVLEKELLLDQVTRLSQPIREKAENCQLDRLPLAKKVNELRSRIIDTNHRMMSIAAELSMKQAAALSLQQEIKEKELQVDGCQRRLEQGLPPCPEMEEEWRKVLRDKRRRQRDKQERERLAEEEERNQLPNGVYTTAEVRPNAYVPEAGSLPLPKPYGALAPFKPSEPGANIRHIRKPRLKPLEI